MMHCLWLCPKNEDIEDSEDVDETMSGRVDKLSVLFIGEKLIANALVVDQPASGQAGAPDPGGVCEGQGGRHP